MKINCETAKGGSVTLNAKHEVSTSYAVVTVGDQEPAEILYTFAKLQDGRRVQFFLNRETNLITVDILNKNGKGGREIVRRNV